MDWPAFFDALGNFILRVGWKVVLGLSVPVLIWKWFDMLSKRGPK